MKTRTSTVANQPQPHGDASSLTSDPPELAAAMARAAEDVAAGRVVPHAKVKAWLARWADGDPGPAPKSGR